MKKYTVFIICIVVGLYSCAGRSNLPTDGSPSTVYVSNDLFRPAEEFGEFLLPEHVTRARSVYVNMDLLLDGEGRARKITQVILNLFPDVVYTGIIDSIEDSGGSISWSGILQGIDNGTFLFVYTSEVFLAHIASPEGIYEVSIIEDDLYRAVMIDQGQFPQD